MPWLPIFKLNAAQLATVKHGLPCDVQSSTGVKFVSMCLTVIKRGIADYSGWVV